MTSRPGNPRRLPPPCPSWVWSSASDTHAAKDRCWFGDDYIPFKSYVTDIAGGWVEVIGMGTIILPTRGSPFQTGSHLNNSLRLKNVLHTPAMLCNIIGNTILDDYTVIPTPSSPDISGVIVANYNGSSQAYFKHMGQGPMLYQVQIHQAPLGHELGISPLCSNGNYLIHAFWSQRERRRMEIFKDSGLTRASGVEELTPIEKRWFGKQCMSEKGITFAYGLDYNRKEHREEARAIMRILKSQAQNEPDFLSQENTPNTPNMPITLDY
ncbi:hypothetical protein N7516_000075 [Penicillium verrucosum]|uniref:uncharacterized protein n=1 Tax=Penicillium verrucosum TaxID=60171 RepID=UPI002545BC79|nr:uncharacterized protein N7516_000075 [Penicillium verrucosum]KAJ5939907.1 hypothetical protein N7516_000075 [Penicillium verrucosum]